MAYNIVIVGCGGTGSILLPKVARYLAAKKTDANLILIDGDCVEKKNLSRQSFFDEDIGINKAMVFAEVIQENFSLNVEAFDRYISTAEDLYRIANNGNVPILIGCVDNMLCRKHINDCFHMFGTAFYIDGGNEYKTGQCVYAAREEHVTISPSAPYYYGEKTDGEKERAAMSCSELNAVEPQHVLANELSAECIFWGIVQILENKIPRGLATFDADKLGITMQQPEDFGFDIDTEVRNYLDELSRCEKIELLQRGKFLQYLINDHTVADEVEKFLAMKRGR